MYFKFQFLEDGPIESSIDTNKNFFHIVGNYIHTDIFEQFSCLFKNIIIHTHIIYSHIEPFNQNDMVNCFMKAIEQSSKIIKQLEQVKLSLIEFYLCIDTHKIPHDLFLITCRFTIKTFFNKLNF